MENVDALKDRALEDFTMIARIRAIEDYQAQIQKPPLNKAAFYLGGAGTELVQTVIAHHLEKEDWVRGYYRNMPLAIALGIVTPEQSFSQLFGDPNIENDPSSGGRQMNAHVASRLLDENGQPTKSDKPRWMSDVSSTGSQMPPALGLALAQKLDHDHTSKGEHALTHVSIGDGAMMEGPALEAVFQAAALGVPLVITALDNGRGISGTPGQFTPHGNISAALKSLEPTMLIIGPVDGGDYETVKNAYEQAFAHTRKTGLPAFIHTKVTQMQGHSSSGDPRNLRSPNELEQQQRDDCLPRMKQFLIDQYGFTAAELDEIIQREQKNAREAEAAAWEKYYSPVMDMGREVERQCATILDTSDIHAGLDLNAQKAVRLTRRKLLDFVRKAIRTARSPELEELLAIIEQDIDARFNSQLYGPEKEVPHVAPEFDPSARRESAGNIISAGYATMMEADPRIVIFGEDVARLGGVQHSTVGLLGGRDQIFEMLRRQGQDEIQLANRWEKMHAFRRHLPREGFGSERIFDTAIAENAIMGMAVGLALNGKFPIAEIQYLDYLVFALAQLQNEIGTLRYRTSGGQQCPMLIRVHGHQLLGINHTGSQMGMILSGCPGIRVLVPRDPVRAIALSRAALQGNDPCIIVDPLLQSVAKHLLPTNLDEICTPLGHSEVLRTGKDITIVTYGQECHFALEAAAELAEEGIDVEVVDLQTLNPLDLNNVASNSITKTRKVLFLDEDIPHGAASMIMAELILRRGGLMYLDAAEILTAKENPAPYGNGPDGRAATKPQPSDIAEKIRGMF